MSYRRILVAVDDSPAGFDAARVAVDLAVGWGGEVRAVTVVRDHTLANVIGAQASDTAQRVAAGAQSVLSWVAELGATRGVPTTVVARDGEPSRRILEEAEVWGAELIVMGRSDRRGPSSPYLGSETAHVLEFSERPVLVIPRADEHGRARLP